MNFVSEEDLREVWLNTELGWEMQASIENSGGMVTVWDSKIITCLGVLKWRYSLCCKLKWVSSGEEFILCNIYGPQTLEGKQSLLENLENTMRGREDEKILLIGDFDMTKNMGETLNCS